MLSFDHNQHVTMKYLTHQRKKSAQINVISALASLSLTTAVSVMLAGSAPSAQAGNVLTNPGFDLPSPGGSLNGWTLNSPQSWAIQVGSSQGSLYRSPANSLWEQGVYTGAPLVIYAYQTVACAAGSTFTANAYFSAHSSWGATGDHSEGGDANGGGLFQADGAGNEDGWIEVAFLDKNNLILADYRSVILDPTYVANLVSSGDVTTLANGDAYINWLNLPVTNQYDPTKIVANADPDSYTAAITNTLASGQLMTAPPNTVNVQYRIALFQAQYEGGAPYYDDCALNLVGGPAPSVIGNLSPNGSQFFNTSSNGFSFTVTSASSGGATLPTNPTSGVKVVVNGTDESSKLQFGGTPTALTVMLPTLTSNTVYNISVTVSNTAGLLSSSSVSFDTFNANAFVVYSEDYDFNGGQFIQNPIPTNGVSANSYWGTAGTTLVDQYDPASITDGGSTLQPTYPNRTDGDVAFQVASDIQMPIYAAQNNSAIYNVALSYNNAGNWCNYTRNPYPQGAYIAYARMSGGNGKGVEYLNILTSGYGTTPQTTNNLGQFVIANGTSWGTYFWVPLTDASGNIKIINIPAGRQTLQLLSGNNCNVADFLFLPAGSAALPPVIANLSPAVDSSTVFMGGTSNLTFTASSPQTTIATSNIVVTLNGTTVPTTITGTSSSWNVSLPLPQNKLETLGISVTDANGLTKTVSYSFDTFSQSNYMFEAEDYDFNGGQFIDNPTPTAPNNTESDSYYYQTGITNIDYIPTFDGGVTYIYRPNDFAGTELTTDFLRAKFVANGSSDYDVGWWNKGEWYNYTRTYPAGTYNVYGRLAGGSAFSGVTLSLVTAGQGTTNQTTKLLGGFSDPNASGWQTWHWIPMEDTNGNIVTITLPGTVQTLQVSGGSGQNANFFMLVPNTTIAPIQLAATAIQGKLVIQIPTQVNHSYTVLYNNTLSGGTWLPLGSSIPGTGATVTVSNSIPAAAGQQFYKVLAQ